MLHNRNGEHTALRGALWPWLAFHQLCGGLMIAMTTCPTRSLECGVRGDVSDVSIVSASSHLLREHNGHKRHPQILHDLAPEPHVFLRVGQLILKLCKSPAHTSARHHRLDEQPMSDFAVEVRVPDTSVQAT